MAPSSLVQKIKNTLNERPFFTLQKVLNKIPLRPFQLAAFFELKLEKFPEKKLRGFGTIREGTVDDVNAMCRFENKDSEIFFDRFNTGEHCVVAIYKEELIGYEWFSSQLNHLESRFMYNLKIPPDSVYTYDAYILPEYRIRGVWLLFQKYIFEKMQQLGRSKVIAMVDYGNDPSLKAHIRFGFTAYKKIYFLRILKNIFPIKTALYNEKSLLKNILSK